jgi:hypothetical protein
MGEREVYVGFFVTEPEGKGPLGRPSRRREDNIEMDFQKVGWEAWI